MEIVAMKRANLDTQNILTTKTTPAQTMNDHISTSHFNAMTKQIRCSTEHLIIGPPSSTTS
jgi:hypothetical protein